MEIKQNSLNENEIKKYVVVSFLAFRKRYVSLLYELSELKTHYS